MPKKAQVGPKMPKKHPQWEEKAIKEYNKAQEAPKKA